MTPRLVRQILYGVLYILIFAVIIFGVYYIWLKPAPTCFDKTKNQGEIGIDCGGPCAPCEIARLKDITSGFALALPARENEISLLGEINNPNLNFGAKTFDYYFNINGPFGVLLKKVEGQSFIYAGEKKYILMPSIPTNLKDVNSVVLKITTSTVIWQSKDELTRPSLNILSYQTTIADNSIAVKGVIKNENPLPIAQTKIMAILYNAQNQIANASYTTLVNLGGNEQKTFSVEFPKGDWVKQINPAGTKIFTEPAPNN